MSRLSAQTEKILKTHEEITNKLKDEIKNNLLNIKIAVRISGINYDDNPDFKKFKNITDRILSLSKDKSKDNYKLEIVSKGDYFLIHREKSMFKIDKSDIIYIGISKNKMRSDSNVLIFDLKNKTNEIEINLDINQCTEYYKSLTVEVEYSFKEEKILEFLFSELHEYIERKNSALFL